MTATGEHENIICLQNFSYGDCCFQYSYENTFKIHPADASANLTEQDVPYEDLTDTIGDDVLEAMESDEGHIFDYLYSYSGPKNEVEDSSYDFTDSIDTHHGDKIYLWVSEPQYVAKELIQVDNICFL